MIVWIEFIVFFHLPDNPWRGHGDRRLEGTRLISHLQHPKVGRIRKRKVKDMKQDTRNGTEELTT